MDRIKEFEIVRSESDSIEVLWKYPYTKRARVIWNWDFTIISSQVQDAPFNPLCRSADSVLKDPGPFMWHFMALLELSRRKELPSNIRRKLMKVLAS